MGFGFFAVYGEALPWAPGFWYVTAWLKLLARPCDMLPIAWYRLNVAAVAGGVTQPSVPGLDSVEPAPMPGQLLGSQHQGCGRPRDCLRPPRTGGGVLELPLRRRLRGVPGSESLVLSISVGGASHLVGESKSTATPSAQKMPTGGSEPCKVPTAPPMGPEVAPHGRGRQGKAVQKALPRRGALLQEPTLPGTCWAPEAQSTAQAVTEGAEG